MSDSASSREATSPAQINSPNGYWAWVTAAHARRLEQLAVSTLEDARCGETPTLSDLEELNEIAATLRERIGVAPGDGGKEEEVRRDLLWLAGEVMRATPGTDEQHRLRERGAVMLKAHAREDPDAARRLVVSPDPVFRAATAAREAAIQVPANAEVLYALVDALVCAGARIRGSGVVLRVERWFDAPFAELTALRGSFEDAATALHRDVGDVRRELTQRGYIDSSDPDLRMAALWLLLDVPGVDAAQLAA